MGDDLGFFFGTDFTDFTVLVFWWGSNAGRAEDGRQNC